MGEDSGKIGDKLEKYASAIAIKFGWEVLAENIEIPCIRSTHKNIKNSDKRTHGVDRLVGYYNPFTKRKEAFIIECKHREWSQFIKSNLNSWIEELCNTIECASTSPKLKPYLGAYTLIGGILLYKSSDNKYEKERALNAISQINVPRRRNPLIVYLADNCRLDQWNSFISEITKIQKQSENSDFGIIYPSIGGSNWDRSPVITPTYLFSDYILASYIKNKNTRDEVETKALFCFENVTDDSLNYLEDMVNVLQLESRLDREQIFDFYFYPQTEQDTDQIQEAFQKKFSSKENFYLHLLDNRNISIINF